MICELTVERDEKRIFNCKCSIADVINDEMLLDNMVQDVNVLGMHQDMIYRLDVSMGVMEVVLNNSKLQTYQIDIWRSMLDIGATVTLIPTSCATSLGL